MHSFQNLQQLIDYVPNCFICNKELGITITTNLASSNGSKKNWPQKHLNIRLEKKDGLLQSMHKTAKLVINPEDNSIVEGMDLVKDMIYPSSYVNKNCPTCHLKVQTSMVDPGKGKRTNFPALTLGREELHFTMKGGKGVTVNKYYSSYQENDLAYIRVSSKTLPPLPFDFNKFNDFEHLVKRISTLIVFH